MCLYGKDFYEHPALASSSILQSGPVNLFSLHVYFLKYSCDTSADLYHLVIVTTLFYPFLTGSLKNLEISIQNGGRLC